jgi:hypothetical protein
MFADGHMNLPNYFLADLPQETTLTPTMVNEACRTLKRNREHHLANRTTSSLIATLSDLAKDWLNRDYEFRKLAVEQAPAATGFSSATIANGLDSFFKGLTKENFEALLEQDLGHVDRLDALGATPVEEKTRRMSTVTGYELLAHVAAGNLPCPALMSIVLGILTRSGQFVKCAGGASFFPRLFAHSLHQADPKLASCLEIAEWRGRTNGQSETKKAEATVISELTEALFAEANCVTATGSDETLASIRRKLPARVKLLGYGHQVSFGYVASGVLSGFNARKLVKSATDDIVAWNQLGCLSPHVIYVEHGGNVSAEQFAEFLATELKEREAQEPRGGLPPEVAANIASRRSIYETRSAYFQSNCDIPDYPATKIWKSENSTAWTVVYEAEPKFQASCLNRFIYVKGITDLTEMLQGADCVRMKVSTVGVAAPADKMKDIALVLARWGATRICPLGQMQQPPLTWRHDGRPALGDLLRWTDYEMD